jgi:hypothetical protein
MTTSHHPINVAVLDDYQRDDPPWKANLDYSQVTRANTLPTYSPTQCTGCRTVGIKGHPTAPLRGFNGILSRGLGI